MKTRNEKNVRRALPAVPAAKKSWSKGKRAAIFGSIATTVTAIGVALTLMLMPGAEAFASGGVLTSVGGKNVIPDHYTAVNVPAGTPLMSNYGTVYTSEDGLAAFDFHIFADRFASTVHTCGNIAVNELGSAVNGKTGVPEFGSRSQHDTDAPKVSYAGEVYGWSASTKLDTMVFGEGVQIDGKKNKPVNLVTSNGKVQMGNDNNGSMLDSIYIDDESDGKYIDIQAELDEVENYMRYLVWLMDQEKADANHDGVVKVNGTDVSANYVHYNDISTKLSSGGFGFGFGFGNTLDFKNYDVGDTIIIDLGTYESMFPPFGSFGNPNGTYSYAQQLLNGSVTLKNTTGKRIIFNIDTTGLGDSFSINPNMTTDNLSNSEDSAEKDNNILYNFYKRESNNPVSNPVSYDKKLTIGGTLMGSVIAPDATVICNSGLNGSIIAKEVTTSCETHKSDYTGERIINTTTNLVIEKVWRNDNEDTRPDFITIRLLRDGEVYKTVQIASGDCAVSTDGNTWRYTFNDLPMSDGSGTTYQYKVEEVAPAGYNMTQVGNTIINTSKAPAPPAPAETKVYKLTVNKVDNNNQPLSNASFTLTANGVNFNTCGKDKAKATVTGADSYQVTDNAITWTGANAVIGNLPAGNYTITETGAPAGYKKAASKTVKLDKDKIENIVNEQIVVKLGKRNGSSDNRELLRGAVLHLAPTSGTVDFSKLYIDGVTNVTSVENRNNYVEWTTTNAQARLMGLPAGSYTLTEQTAPEGYDKAAPVTFTVYEDGSVNFSGKYGTDDVTMLDKLTPVQPKKYSLTINKTNGTNALPGAQLTLTNVAGASLKGAKFNGNEITADGASYTFTTDGNAAVFTDLLEGSYTLSEDSAPAGYKKAADMGITLDSDKPVTMVDEPIVITIIKKDSTSGEQISGATFRLSNTNGYSKELTTDSEGVITFTDLTPGSYTLTEVAPPAGYTKDFADITFTVDEYGNVSGDAFTGSTATVYNTPTKLYISKLGLDQMEDDDDSNDVTSALAGAELRIISDDSRDLSNVSGIGEVGHPSATEITFTSGYEPVELRGLPDGRYTLREDAAPHGYDRADDITFTVANGVVSGVQNNTVVMTDVKTPYYPLHFSKVDENNVFLPGATIGIFNGDETDFSAENAIVVFQSDEEVNKVMLKNGSYILYELEAPEGYQRNEDKIPFTANKGTPEIVNYETTTERTHNYKLDDVFSGKDSFPNRINVGTDCTRFELYTGNTLIFSGTPDGNGYITLSDMPGFNGGTKYSAVLTLSDNSNAEKQFELEYTTAATVDVTATADVTSLFRDTIGGFPKSVTIPGGNFSQFVIVDATTNSQVYSTGQSNTEEITINPWNSFDSSHSYRVEITPTNGTATSYSLYFKYDKSEVVQIGGGSTGSDNTLQYTNITYGIYSDQTMRLDTMKESQPQNLSIKIDSINGTDDADATFPLSGFDLPIRETNSTTKVVNWNTSFSAGDYVLLKKGYTVTLPYPTTTGSDSTVTMVVTDASGNTVDTRTVTVKSETSYANAIAAGAGFYMSPSINFQPSGGLSADLTIAANFAGGNGQSGTQTSVTTKEYTSNAITASPAGSTSTTASTVDVTSTFRDTVGGFPNTVNISGGSYSQFKIVDATDGSTVFSSNDTDGNIDISASETFDSGHNYRVEITPANGAATGYDIYFGYTVTVSTGDGSTSSDSKSYTNATFTDTFDLPTATNLAPTKFKVEMKNIPEGSPPRMTNLVLQFMSGNDLIEVYRSVGEFYFPNTNDHIAEITFPDGAATMNGSSSLTMQRTNHSTWTSGKNYQLKVEFGMQGANSVDVVVSAVYGGGGTENRTTGTINVPAAAPSTTTTTETKTANRIDKVSQVPVITPGTQSSVAVIKLPNTKIPVFEQHKCSVELVKKDENGNTITGNSASFLLYDKNGYLVTELAGADGNYNYAKDSNAVNTIDNPLSTGSNGILTVNGLNEGEYYFREVAAPSNYEQGIENIPFAVDRNSISASVDAVNVRKTGSITLNKVDSNGLPRAGAQFALWSVDMNYNNPQLVAPHKVFTDYGAGPVETVGTYTYTGNTETVETLVTGDDGKIKITNLPLGRIYYFTEIAAPDGCIKAEGNLPALGTATDLPEGSYYYNDLHPYGIALGENVNVQILQYTENNGSYSGAYVQKTVSVLHSDITVSNNVYQTQILKADAVNGEALADAVLKLTAKNTATNLSAVYGSLDVFYGEENGLDYITWTTGTAANTLYGLPAGQYILSETSAPSGYNLAQPVEITVDAAGNINGAQVYTFNNYRYTGSITINKVDEAGNALTGAGFKLYTEDGEGVRTYIAADGSNGSYSAVSIASAPEDVAELFTDENGRLVVTGLDWGKTYKLHETTVPESFFEPTSDSSFVLTSEHTDVEQNVVNTRQLLNVQKVYNGEMAEGQQFVLTVTGRFSDGNSKEIIITKDNVNTVIPVSGAIAGESYTISEAVPYGYDVAYNPATVTAENGNAATLVATNTHKTLSISKKTINGTEELAGATLKVTDKDGKTVIAPFTSGTAPTSFNLVNFAPGAIYTLTETTAPYGYEIAESIQFTVNAEGQVSIVNNKGERNGNTIVMRDDYKKLYISKQDINGTEELAGATLKVTDANGNVVIDEFTSGTAPTYFNIVEFTPGEVYTLTETTAPYGYEIAENINFTVDAAGKVYIVNADNTRTERTDKTVVMKDDYKKLAISKQDINGTEELAGATLKVTDKDGKTVIAPFTSGTAPTYFNIVEFTPDAVYTLTETTAPFGYEIAENINFTVDATGKVYIVGADGTKTERTDKTVVMKDDYKKLAISKQDINGTEELAGATLKVTDKDGKTVIAPFTSGTAPTYFNIVEFTPGEVYTLTETTAPYGYEIAENINFTVDAAGKVYIVNADNTRTERTDKTVVMKDDYKTLSISKQEINSTNELPGAKLKVTDKDGKTVIEEFTSGTAPTYFNIVEFTPGEVYTLTETTAPYGYEIAENINFTVDAAGKVYIVNADGTKTERTDKTVVMKDDFKKLYISKQEINSTSELPGAKLKVTDKDGKTVIEEFTSGTKPTEFNIGKFTPDAVYTLTETTAPNGYELAENIQFTVDKNGKVYIVNADGTKTERSDSTVIMKDARIPGTVNLTKKGDDDKKLGGAGFIVYTTTADGKKLYMKATGQNGVYALTGETDKAAEATEMFTIADGTLTVSNMDWSKGYWFYEKTAPTGYDLPAEASRATKVTMTATQRTASPVITNKRHIDMLSIIKKMGSGTMPDDKQFEIVISGKFADGSTEKTVVIKKDNLDKPIAVEGIVDGETYTISEKAIDGFFPNYSATSVKADKTKDQTVTVTNYPESTVVFTKYSNTNKALSGAKFRLTGANNFSKEVTTGSDGVVTFSGLEPGTYSLTETQAPSGHTASTAIITVKVSETGAVTCTDATGKTLSAADLQKAFVNNVVKVAGSSHTDLQVGETVNLGEEIKNKFGDVTVTWTSSNPDIASVDSNGKVTVHKPGNVTITASAGNSPLMTFVLGAEERSINTNVTSPNTGEKILKITLYSLLTLIISALMFIILKDAIERSKKRRHAR
ncbi:MAG: Cna B-type domain-containing protein [Ruminococcaceae bacterium]|nr:Cna B-type domain-containing protein [Oscillospiraceae bacterium]